MIHDNKKAKDGPRWIQYPEDTLAAARMLLLYFGFLEYATNSRINRLAVYPRAIWRGRLLLGCYKANTDLPRQEYLVLGENWKSNLITAGINPETLTVQDEKRWALTWEGLTRSKPIFYPYKIEARYEARDFIPEEDALKPQPFWPKTKQRAKIDESQARNQYLSQRFNDVLSKRFSQ